MMSFFRSDVLYFIPCCKRSKTEHHKVECFDLRDHFQKSKEKIDANMAMSRGQRANRSETGVKIVLKMSQRGEILLCVLCCLSYRYIR